MKLKGSNNSDKNSGKSEAFTFLRPKFTKNLFFGHLNVNSVKNKFATLKFLIKDKFEFLIKDKFDVFLVSASKLDTSFPEAQSNTEMV